MNDLSDRSADLCSDDDGPGDFGDYACVPGGLKQVDLIPFDNIPHKEEVKAYVVIGSNDIFNDPDLLTAPADELVEAPTNNTVSIVERLIEKGILVENIVVTSLPSLEETPEVTFKSRLIPELPDIARDISNEYYAQLKEKLSGYIVQHLTYIDVRSWHRAEIGKARWVQNVVETTCVKDEVQESCKVGDDSDKNFYFFFDNKHPTVKGQKVLFNHMGAVAGE